MPRGAAVVSVAVLVAVTAAVFVPFLTESREIPVSTPSTAPLFGGPALVELAPGSRACLDNVLLDSDADLARFRVATSGRPGEPLTLTLAAGGYREQGHVAGGYADNAQLSVAIAGPKHDLLGTACIANRGHRPVSLYATTEARTLSRVGVEVDGTAVPADVALSFYQRRTESLLARTPAAVAAMTAFRPVGIWFTWPLLVAVLVGLPGLALWAFWRSFAADPGVRRAGSAAGAARRAEDRHVVEGGPDQPRIDA